MVELPTEDEDRKAAPMYRALIAPFAWALFQIAKHGARWNEKHNPPGSPITLKSMSPDEHCDSLVRHIADAAGGGPEELAHRIGIAWRGLAQLQEFGRRALRNQAGELIGPEDEVPGPAPERWGVFWKGNHSRSSYCTGDYPSDAAALAALRQRVETRDLLHRYTIERLP